MFQVGEVDSEGKRLITITELCLKSAIEICKPNEHFCSIGNIYMIKNFDLLMSI